MLKRLLRPCVMLSLAGALTAATAQGLLRPCNSLPSGERESAQAIGACREGPPIVDVRPDRTATPPTVVVPVPPVVGLSFDDARSRLTGFTVSRSYVASAEPGGTVVEQQPAPPARLGVGAVVRVVVSDGSLRPAPAVAAAEIDGVRKPAEARPPVATQARRTTAANSSLSSRGNADALRQAPTPKSTRLAQGSAGRSDAPAGRAKAASASQRGGDALTPPRVTETLELPNVIGRSSADATAALAEFKVERIEVVANAAPSGQVLAQDPAPGAQVPAGTSIGLQVSDGSLANASAAPRPAAPAVAPVPQPAAVAATPARAPMTFPGTAVLLLIAGVLVGIGLGAILMRRWLMKRFAAQTGALAPAVVAPPPTDHFVTPHATIAGNRVEPAASPLPAMAPAPITFSARLEEGATTIAFTASDADEMTLEHSRDFHE